MTKFFVKANTNAVADNIGKYMLLPLNAQGSAANKAEIQGSLYVEASEATITGTTTGVWANAGWFTASGDGATAWGANNADTADAFMDRTRFTSTYPYSGLLIHFDLYITAAPTSWEVVFASGDKQANPEGGWELFLPPTTGVLTIDYKTPGSGTKSVSSAALTTGVRNSVLIYFDYVNTTQTIYLNGASPVVSAAWGSLLTSDSLRNFALFGGGGSTQPPTSLLLGEFSSGARMKNFFMLNPAADISADLAALASGFYLNEDSLPTDLVTLGIVGV